MQAEDPSAQVGDWVVGTGSKHYDLEGHIVYAMQVAEILSFDNYWSDPRFARKRPNLHGSLKQAYGDNIYHRDAKTGDWLQADSHHSEADGSANPLNVSHDTQTDTVLVGGEYYYWGAGGPVIPSKLRDLDGHDICHSGRGHKCNFSSSLVELFITWIRSQECHGYVGEPVEFEITHG